MVYSNQDKIVVHPNSIDKEASRAFKKVKFDIEELRKLINTKQDKQTNVLIEMNNMRSELKIEFREELLELQKTLSQEIDALRQEVLYYRDIMEQHRADHHKVKAIKERTQPIPQSSVVQEFSYENIPESINDKEEEKKTYKPITQSSIIQEFSYENVPESVSEEKEKNYKPTPQAQNFNVSINNSNQDNNKTYLKWITVGDKDLDSIDEVIIR